MLSVHLQMHGNKYQGGIEHCQTKVDLLKVGLPLLSKRH